ncbi:hypothetical protein [Micromonospora sagamiensis]|uniref:Uncharacterized protein n=1 Tax=Micromonospora sagamiensis TaxID=47875 RepID=A0A562WA05_9ACTN|nr:hypothetical protein [Micromonospora sagamiensis]TWJ26955.1 hypothetical protein JD81_00437 [Micromonospora sagamiensis]
MTRVLAALLVVASVGLPARHRARWREEALAVLLAVRGGRRWRYAVDTVAKVPLLAWQYRRTDPPGEPARWPSIVAGAWLLGTPALLAGAVVAAPVIGEDAAEFFFLLAPSGMLPVVAVRAGRWAVNRGGVAFRCTVVALLAAFAGTGPVAAGALSIALDQPLVALVGSVVPGLWLIATNVADLRRGRQPAALSGLGATAGAALVGLLLGLQLAMLSAGTSRPATALGALSFLLLVPTYAAWSVWTGLRLLRKPAIDGASLR